MVNPPFDVIFSAYVEQQYVSFWDKCKQIPAHIKIIFLISILLLTLCFWTCYSQCGKLFVLSILGLLTMNYILDKETKRVLKPNPGTFSNYRKDTVSPLRSLLKKYRMYSAASIQYLIECCDQEVAKETTIERMKRILKSYFSFVWKLLCLAGFGVLLKQLGVDSSNTQVSSMFLDLLLYFDTYYAIALLLIVGLFACEVAFIYYETQVMLEDITNRKRNQIRRLSDDLQFVLIDFQSR